MSDTLFWSRVDRSGPTPSHVPQLGPCWVWRGARVSKGYGSLKIGGRNASAHRTAWESAFGDIPDEMHVLHRCDNPPCCNPAHLFLGTNADNVADKVAKGRVFNSRKTQCKNGHPFDDVNTYRWTGVGRRPSRQCLTCKANVSAEAQKARRLANPELAKAKSREHSRKWREEHNSAEDRAKTREYMIQWRARRRAEAAA